MLATGTYGTDSSSVHVDGPAPDPSGNTVDAAGDGGATLVCGAACVGAAASSPDDDPHTGGGTGGGIDPPVGFKIMNRRMVEMIAQTRVNYL